LYLEKMKNYQWFSRALEEDSRGMTLLSSKFNRARYGTEILTPLNAPQWIQN